MKDRLPPLHAEQMVDYVRTFSEGKHVVEPEKELPLPPLDKPTTIPGTKESPTEAAERAKRMREATVQYRQYCFSCHGLDGRGSELRASMPTIPDFTSRKWQEETPAAQMVVSILDGKGTQMPSFRDRIAEAQARDLAAYIQFLGPERPPAPPPPDGDFERRFKELQDQWNELQRKLRELSKPPPTP
jgi:mono/diheme cytochrome c family protein